MYQDRDSYNKLKYFTINLIGTETKIRRGKDWVTSNNGRRAPKNYLSKNELAIRLVNED